jgi:UDP-glucose 4-epimerase
VRVSDGTGVRDYIHIVDLAKGHVAAGRAEGGGGRERERERERETWHHTQ